MNEKKIQQVLSEIAKEEAPSQSINLLGRVQAGLQPSTPNIQRKSRSWAAGFVVLLLVGFVFFAMTPQGRVIADGVLDFFIQVDSDIRNMDASRTANAVRVETEGTATPNPAFGPDFYAVSEVETQAGYDVLEPEWMPQNYVLKGATFDAEAEIAYQHWEWRQDGTRMAGLFLSQERITTQEECELCAMVGASAIVEEVSINEAKGEYVIGVWKLVEEGAIWENDPYLQRLKWQVDDMAFELLFMGPDGTLTMEELLQIAESLR